LKTARLATAGNSEVASHYLHENLIERVIHNPI